MIDPGILRVDGDPDYSYDTGSSTGRGVIVAGNMMRFEYMPRHWVLDFVAMGKARA